MNYEWGKLIYFSTVKHLPDRVNLFNVWFKDDTWYWFCIKVGLYPFFLALKFSEMIYVDNFIDHVVNIEGTYYFVQVIVLWLIFPPIISIYGRIFKGLGWLIRVGE